MGEWDHSETQILHPLEPQNSLLDILHLAKHEGKKEAWSIMQCAALCPHPIVQIPATHSSLCAQENKEKESGHIAVSA